MAEEHQSDIDDDTAYVQIAVEFMGLLLAAGFHTQSVMEHGLEYMQAYSPDHVRDWAKTHLFAAKIVYQAAKTLRIDLETQRGLYSRKGGIHSLQ